MAYLGVITCCKLRSIKPIFFFFFFLLWNLSLSLILLNYFHNYMRKKQDKNRSMIILFKKKNNYDGFIYTYYTFPHAWFCFSVITWREPWVWWIRKGLAQLMLLSKELISMMRLLSPHQQQIDFGAKYRKIFIVKLRPNWFLILWKSKQNTWLERNPGQRP